MLRAALDDKPPPRNAVLSEAIDVVICLAQGAGPVAPLVTTDNVKLDW